MELTTLLRTGRILSLALLLAPAAALAGDWHQWRGPEQNGVSREKNLPETWDPDSGENVVWKTEGVGGMSSPIVMKGKLYTLTRTGDVPSPDGDVIPGPQTQEALVCLDANTGKALWKHTENVFQTDLPFHRIGWSNPVGDPETNRVYVYGAQGVLYALDAETGKEVWKRSMAEDFGMISTFGGRTPTPAIDEDQLYISGVAFGWGDNARSQYRMFCLDKNTGELRWTNGTGGIPVDAPYQTPSVNVINGEKLVVTGSGDGTVTAFQARTGKKAWSHKVSKRGLNASVLVDGNVVYAGSSEENLTGNRMGTVVAIDTAGGQPKELWRRDGIECGFGSPTIHEDRLYVIDNGAAVHALDTKTGKTFWRKKVGTIGKASLVYADGKLYVPEANGKMTVLALGEDKPEVVSKAEVPDKLGREYSVFGSVAVANGRVYLATATTVYCIGPKEAKSESDPIPEPAKEEPVAQGAKPAQIQVLPADAVVRQGGSHKFRARAFDEKGRLIGDVNDAAWSIGKLTFEAPPRALPVAPANREAPPGGQPQAAATPKAEAEAKPQAAAAPAPAAPAAPPQPEKIQIGNLYGELGNDGTYKAPGDAGALLGGAVVAKVGDVSGYSRVRVVPPFPWRMGFTNAAAERPPLTWIGAGGKFAVQEKEGEKLLTKLTNIDLYARARTYLGTSDMHDYTIQADVKVDSKQSAGRQQVPDVGVVNSRYALMLYGNHQRAELHAWQSALPYATHKTIDYKWEPGKWYRLKLRVDQKDGKAVVLGKVWPREGQEPAEWTLQLEDPSPNTHGSPGLFGNSLVSPFPSFVYYDNILVADNKSENARAAN
jgi:outer membrane protein assembly factor BamB